MVVVCGSATSWIQNNLINNHGGLYGRVSREIKLSPFTLEEMEQYFKERDIRMSRYDIVQANMIVGGIPYYLQYFSRGCSLAQNVDNILFSKDATLRGEYNRLFSSVFTKPDEMKEIVELLSGRRGGYSRKEIINELDIADNGQLSSMLRSLVASDFITRYVPFGNSNREEYYKLIDPFCLFFIRFVKNSSKLENDFWMTNVTSPRISSWRGYAFEEVCLWHFDKIKGALGISGVSTSQSAWVDKGNDEEGGCQIDLIIDRKDGIVNMCEMKFYNTEFTVSKSYRQVLVGRYNKIDGKIKKRQSINPVLVTSFGLVDNEYSGFFQNVITLDDLF